MLCLRTFFLLHVECCFIFVDDDSDTATEGEEEIRARELRKQEVRVEPPVVHTDTGTDTEVKPTSNLLEPKNSELPDILSNHDKLKPNKSSDNLSAGSSPDSADFDSCIGSPDKNVISPPKPHFLVKSATAGNLAPPKVKRNFVIPPKEQRKSFGKEFIPTYQNPEPQPLLIIKRTPSKINLPPEIGKPKVALKVNMNTDTKKYFGENSTKMSAKPPKPILKRAETLKNSATQNKLVKQISLPETEVEKEKTNQSFNFEPEDADLNDVDNYIEDLLAKKDELLKPIDPKKYTFTAANDSSEGEVSSSIEDLLKALEIETKVEVPEITEKPDEKIEDLLNWMDNLDYQTQERKVYRSYSDVKYKNLERILKAPKKADAVISKIPKDNLTYFERHMSGKTVEEPEMNSNFKLARSKTDVFCNKPRTSVDLDAVTKVDIKKVLMKFERQTNDDELENRPPVNLPKRKSFSSFKFATKNQEERNIANSKSMVNVSQIRENLLNKARSASNSRRNSFTENSQKEIGSKVENKNNKKELEKDVDELSSILKDIEDFVDNTINKIGNADVSGESETDGVGRKKSELALQLLEKAVDGRNKQIVKKSPVIENKNESENKNGTVEKKNSNFTLALQKSPVNANKMESGEKPLLSVKAGDDTNGSTDSVHSLNSNLTLELPKSSVNANNVESAEKTFLTLKAGDNINGSTESVHSFRSATGTPNSLETETTPTQYSVTISVTESRIFPQFQQQSLAPPQNIDDLYAKVNKQNKKSPPSPTPRRNKKETEAPQRPMRQKSFEGRHSNKTPTPAFKSQIPVPQENKKPIAPQRKRSTTASPQLNRKNTNTEPKKETVKSFNAPKPQRVEMRNRDSKSKEKDCCLQ